MTDSFEVGHFWSLSPFAVVLSMIMVFGGLAGLVAVWLLPRPSHLVQQSCAFVGVMLCIVFPIAFVIHGRAFYPTDSAAFDHVASLLLVHGRNPYGSSLGGAAQLLFSPAQLWTYTVSGGRVLQVSYPAGSVLSYAPAFLLGFRHMVVSWVDLIAWMVSAGLLWALLPRSMRYVVALLAITPIFVGSFGSGGTDALWMPWMILAVWKWDRFGVRRADGAGVVSWFAAWVGPVALGVACSIKQTPWFFVPVLAIAVGMEACRDGRRWWAAPAAYVGIVLAVFAAVNLPFIVWQPTHWLHGVLLPFTGGLIADGQGLVGIATHGMSTGVDIGVLSISALLAYFAILAAFVAWYSRLKQVIVLLLPFSFVLAPRSLGTYLVNLVPVAFVAAVTVRDISGLGTSDADAATAAAQDATRTAGARVGRVTLVAPAGPVIRRVASTLFAALVAAVVATSAYAFAVQPVRVTVDRLRPTRSLEFVEWITVTVRNETSSPMSPHFMVNSGPGVNGFWRAAGRYGPIVIPPHGAVTLRLLPRLATRVPPVGSSLLVEVYTPSPNALSLASVVWQGPAPKLNRPH